MAVCWICGTEGEWPLYLGVDGEYHPVCAACIERINAEIVADDNAAGGE